MPPLILFPIKPPLLIYVGQEWPVLFEQAKEPGGPRAALQPEHHRGGHVARGGREEPEEEVGGGAGVDGDEPGVGGEEGEGAGQDQPSHLAASPDNRNRNLVGLYWLIDGFPLLLKIICFYFWKKVSNKIINLLNVFRKKEEAKVFFFWGGGV